jgi:hypothetical protein
MSYVQDPRRGNRRGHTRISLTCPVLSLSWFPCLAGARRPGFVSHRTRVARFCPVRKLAIRATNTCEPSPSRNAWVCDADEWVCPPYGWEVQSLATQVEIFSGLVVRGICTHG